MKIHDRILELVKYNSINRSKLGVILISEYPRLNGNQVLQEIDKLVSSGHLIEVECLHPDWSGPEKLYFPKETKFRLSVN